MSYTSVWGWGWGYIMFHKIFENNITLFFKQYKFIITKFI